MSIKVFFTYDEALEEVDEGNDLALFGYSLTMQENRIYSASLYIIAGDLNLYRGPGNRAIFIHQISDEFYNDDATKKSFIPKDVPSEAKTLKYCFLQMTNSEVLDALRYGVEIAFGFFMQNTYVRIDT